MKALLNLLASAVLTTFLIQSSMAQQAISPYVVASGGGLQVGQPYGIVATVGQPIAAATDALLAGFWYMLASGIETSIEQGQSDPSIPATFRLHQNYPNPFNPTTTLSYELPKASDINLVIIDMLGRVVESLVTGHQSLGRHTVSWEANDHAGGVYFYRIKAGDFVETRKMVLMK